MTVPQSARSTHRRAGVVTRLILAWVCVAWLPGVASGQPDRVVAIGDIHGADGEFRALLEVVGLTDADQRWIGGRTTLVQTGDFTDRGPGVKAVLDLLMRLETEAAAAGGQLVVLLGNHETMNIMSGLRDTTAELLARFATSRSKTLRAEAYLAYVELMRDRSEHLGPLATEPMPEAEWLAAHPLGFFEYMEALGPDGRYGRWLRSKQVVTRVGDTILLHGGLHPDKAPIDLGEINERARRELETYDRYRQRLTERGVILPFFTFQETVTAVTQELNYWATVLTPTGPPDPDAVITLTPRDRAFVDMLVDLQNLRLWSVIDEDGPVWFRGFARWSEEEGLPQARLLMEQHDVSRMVVGHTIPATRLITPRFGDRVFLIDTGMLVGYYQGRASALEIVGDQVTAVYLDGRVPLVEAP